MSKAKLYGVGVGPGDPELLTAKAIHVIRECAVVAVPQSGAGDQAALAIAAEYIGDKPVLHCDMPMTRDKAARDASHDRAADENGALVDEGKGVAGVKVRAPTVDQRRG
mgnify:CR=1 FL=1